MKLLILTATLLFSTYTFSGVKNISELVSDKSETTQFLFTPIIPKRPPVNDDGPGGIKPPL